MKRATTAFGEDLKNQSKSWSKCCRELRAVCRRLEMLESY